MNNKPDERRILEIAMETVSKRDGYRTVISLLPGEIKGASLVFHGMLAGDTEKITGDSHVLHVMFLLTGNVKLAGNGHETPIKTQAAFIPEAGKKVNISASEESQWLEIRWDLNDNDVEFLAESDLEYPIVSFYDRCAHYRDPFKSNQTISRSIIGHHLLPRICMGSVESYGFDRVEPHAHPLIDQFFFSFPENDAELLVDGARKQFRGNTLVHIPLGSTHGVEVRKGKKMHYLWIDFILNKKGIDYLNKLHRPIGIKQNFDKNE